MGAYDQFAENKTKFGVQTDFDITVYSTRVNADEVPEYVFFNFQFSIFNLSFILYLLSFILYH